MTFFRIARHTAEAPMRDTSGLANPSKMTRRLCRYAFGRMSSEPSVSTRLILALPLISVILAAQTTGDADLLNLTRELRDAVGGDSLTSAADLAAKLDDAVQQRYKAWLVRDADQRVNEVLTWLPRDIESVWVNQEPLTIKPGGIARAALRPACPGLLNRPFEGGQWSILLPGSWGAHSPARGVSRAEHQRAKRDSRHRGV